MDAEQYSYQQRLQWYRELFTKAVAQNLHRDPEVRSRFNDLWHGLGLNPLTVGELEQDIIQTVAEQSIRDRAGGGVEGLHAAIDRLDPATEAPSDPSRGDAGRGSDGTNVPAGASEPVPLETGIAGDLGDGSGADRYGHGVSSNGTAAASGAPRDAIAPGDSGARPEPDSRPMVSADGPTPMASATPVPADPPPPSEPPSEPVSDRSFTPSVDDAVTDSPDHDASGDASSPAAADAVADPLSPALIQRYEQAVWDATQRSLPILDEDWAALESLRQELGLSQTVGRRIEIDGIDRAKAEEAAYQQRCQRYQETVREICGVEWPPGLYAQHQLRQQQQLLGIRDHDIPMLTDPVVNALRAQTHATTEPTAETQPHPPAPTEAATPSEPAPAATSESAGTSPESPTAPPPDRLLDRFPDDYEALEVALAGKHWQEADYLTFVLLLKLTQREAENCLDASAIHNLQYQDLLDIDRLWSLNSQGKFGFVAQRNIYEGLLADHKRIPKRAIAFAKAVGWWSDILRVFKVYSWLDFDLTRALPGHLPALWFWKVPFLESLLLGGFGTGRGFSDADPGTLSTFMARLGVYEPADDGIPGG